MEQTHNVTHSEADLLSRVRKGLKVYFKVLKLVIVVEKRTSLEDKLSSHFDIMYSNL